MWNFVELFPEFHKILFLLVNIYFFVKMDEKVKNFEIFCRKWKR